MSPELPTATTTGAVDLARLAAELGTDALTMCEVDGVRTITCFDETITVDGLEAAVAAHDPTRPPSPTEELQAQIDDLADYIATL